MWKLMHNKNNKKKLILKKKKKKNQDISRKLKVVAGFSNWWHRVRPKIIEKRIK